MRSLVRRHQCNITSRSGLQLLKTCCGYFRVLSLLIGSMDAIQSLDISDGFISLLRQTPEPTLQGAFCNLSVPF